MVLEDCFICALICGFWEGIFVFKRITFSGAGSCNPSHATTLKVTFNSLHWLAKIIVLS